MLPTESKVWPPSEWEQQYWRYSMHSAWYSADMERLGNMYAAYLGGGRDASTRFWARDQGKQRSTIMHLPVASDISATSANLLFGNAPDVKAEDDPTQARLDYIVESNLLEQVLLEAAESASALGGVFLKVNWDLLRHDFPIISTVQADAALPEFVWGRLVSCTFWEVLETNKDVVWRRLERHEPGSIETGLYRGTDGRLGIRLPLTSHPKTAEDVDLIPTGYDRLLCVYVPNSLPNRRERGSRLGRSDYEGLESFMDSLDEVWTSLQRDIRLGFARLAVPESMVDLQNSKLRFDVDREMFLTINALQSASPENLKLLQGSIRSVEHLATAEAMFANIVTMAGYSPQSFGLYIDGNAQSGTALEVRERKSKATTAKKALYWTSNLEELLEAVLFVDRNHLANLATVPQRPEVTCRIMSEPSIVDLAPTVEALERARSMSTELRVRTLHPDWGEDRVAEEVALISTETAPAPLPAFDNGPTV